MIKDVFARIYIALKTLSRSKVQLCTQASGEIRPIRTELAGWRAHDRPVALEATGHETNTGYLWCCSLGSRRLATLWRRSQATCCRERPLSQTWPSSSTVSSVLCP